MLSTTNYAQNYAGIIGQGLIANIHRVFPLTDSIISSLGRSLAYNYTRRQKCRKS